MRKCANSRAASNRSDRVNSVGRANSTSRNRRPFARSCSSAASLRIEQRQTGDARSVPYMAVQQRFQLATIMHCNGCVNHINVLFLCDIFIAPKPPIHAH